MRKTAIFAGLVCGVLFFAAGCTPNLAPGEPGAKEATWEKYILDSYPGYKRPKIAPPAIVDNVSPRLIESEEAKAAEAVDKAADDVAPAPAADIVVTETAVVETAPAAETAAPAVDTPAPAPAPAVGSTVIHEVKAGETLSGIAKKYYGAASKYSIIIKANGITDAGKICIGTKLTIPQL